jgi:hypothetical protein
MTPVVHTHSGGFARPKFPHVTTAAQPKFPHVITIVGEKASGDFEWLTKELLERCPVLYSLGKEILESIRAEFPGELVKEKTPRSHEYKDSGGPADNFWTVTAEPWGSTAAGHGRVPPEPCLKFSLYGRDEQRKVNDGLEVKVKRRGAFGASYCEVKVHAARDIPDLMERLRLAYKEKLRARP